jgi:hypothetical protein
MYYLEIFLKKRKFSAIYTPAWTRLSAHITYPPDTEDAPEQRLAFFGALSYATGYQSALAAGMSTSAAHYLARVLLRKFKFEEWLNEALIALFAPDDEGAQAYADGFLARVGALVERVCSGEGMAEPAVELAMVDLSEFYRKVSFSSPI